MKFITNIDNVLAKIWLEFTSNLFLAGLKWYIFLSVILINLFDMMPVQIFFFKSISMLHFPVQNAARQFNQLNQGLVLFMLCANFFQQIKENGGGDFNNFITADCLVFCDLRQRLINFTLFPDKLFNFSVFLT